MYHVLAKPSLTNWWGSNPMSLRYRLRVSNFTINTYSKPWHSSSGCNMQFTPDESCFWFGSRYRESSSTIRRARKVVAIDGTSSVYVSEECLVVWNKILWTNRNLTEIQEIAKNNILRGRAGYTKILHNFSPTFLASFVSLQQLYCSQYIRAAKTRLTVNGKPPEPKLVRTCSLWRKPASTPISFVLPVDLFK